MTEHLSPERYRKKPVVIEAMRLPDAATPDIPRMLAVQAIAKWCGGRVGVSPCVLIDTLEGEMRADPGDWIIRGVKGEFYPCKPDIFSATYEPVFPLDLPGNTP